MSIDFHGVNDQNLDKLIKLEAYKGYNWFVEVNQFKAGMSFGELALVSDKPRAATIRAKEDCILAVMHKDDYNKMIRLNARRALNEKISFIEKLDCISHL